jgi:hypothetical protein
VRLAFAETRRRAPGERVFTVRVNGVPAGPRIDLAREPGPFAAVERTVRVTTGPGEGVVIAFEAAAGRPTVSGIAVRRVQ